MHDPIFTLMEGILGPGFQACGQNVIRNAPGVAITRFHVDDTVEFPLPEGVARHDPRITMPARLVTEQAPDLVERRLQRIGPRRRPAAAHLLVHGGVLRNGRDARMAGAELDAEPARRR